MALPEVASTISCPPIGLFLLQELFVSLFYYNYQVSFFYLGVGSYDSRSHYIRTI